MNARIGIDCRLAGKEHAGIGRYIAELVPRIVQHQEVDWVLFFRNKSQQRELFSSTPPTHVSFVNANIQHYSLNEQIKMAKIFEQADLDLLHVPHFNLPFFYSGTTVLTIHDLLWHQYRGSKVTTLSPWKYWLKYGFYKLVTKRAIGHAASILVPSKVIANTVAEFYSGSAHKLSVTYEGVATELVKKAQQKNYMSRDPGRLLYVGSLYPHKNVQLVLDALKQLPKYKFVVVSSRSAFADEFTAQVENLGLTTQVEFLGSIDDKQLAAEYQKAHALIQPSKSEGFGLTGIESLIFKTPVLAADTAIFHEIYQQAAIYFDPENSGSLIDAIKKLESKKVYQEIQTAAPKVSAQYSWDELVEKTWQVYKKVLKKDHK